jgi:hypothetical protein
MKITIPAGFVLYRGARRPLGYQTNNQSYFLYGNDGANITRREYTSKKGPDVRVYTYMTTRSLKLLDMSNPSNIMKLLGKAVNVENVIRSIQQSFRLKDNIVYRLSESEEDLVVAKFICKLGYDGYWAPKMLKSNTSNNKFHQEIVLCQPRDKISLVQSPVRTRHSNNYSTPPGTPRGTPRGTPSPAAASGSPPPMMRGKQRVRQPMFNN